MLDNPVLSIQLLLRNLRSLKHLTERKANRNFGISHAPLERYGEYEKEQITMAQEERRNWRELCKAALRAKDPDDVLKILQELNQALKSEEQVRRDFRAAMRTTSPQ